MGGADTCPSLLVQRSALAVSCAIEGGGGWLAEWEAVQRKAFGPGNTFSASRGWEEVQRAKEERGGVPNARKFDEASAGHEWDLASLVDTEEASVLEAADRRDKDKEVRELDELFGAIYPLIRQYELEHAAPDEHKVVEYLSSQELALAVNLALPEEGSSTDFIQGCQDALRYSVRTSHPRFMNQLFAGSEPSGQVAELLTSVINNSVHTYGAAPFATVIEKHLIERVGSLAGFRDADGVFCPGGSYANMGAMLVARNELFPHVHQDGWQPNDRPVVFTSAQAHYSVKKAAMILGIGTANCVLVPTDRNGCMQSSALESLILTAKSQGRTPFFVSCTSGTTVTGSFDPLRPLVQLCREHRVWVHADGAWGGAVIFSDKHRHLVDGLEGCDSFCFNPHKLLGVSSQCTLLLLNQQAAAPGEHAHRHHGCCSAGALMRSNDTLADYLFHSTTQEERDDLGHRSLQCGRKPDCLKLWLHWKRHGTRGLARRVERAFAYARRLAHMVARDERFHLILRPSSCNVCFYYLPPAVRARMAATAGKHNACAAAGSPRSKGEGCARVEGAGAGVGAGVVLGERLVSGEEEASMERTCSELRELLGELDAVTQTVYRRMQLKGSMLVCVGGDAGVCGGVRMWGWGWRWCVGVWVIRIAVRVPESRHRRGRVRRRQRAESHVCKCAPAI
jgi:glutamate/tyrosine decarboxylase-like PLP-dependent enzyme